MGLVSDVNAKENFRDVARRGRAGEIAAMSIQEWNYKAQDASIRHMGPTAQDFRAAFGLGTIRYASAPSTPTAWPGGGARRSKRGPAPTNERLTRENDELRARLARLESLLEKR